MGQTVSHRQVRAEIRGSPSKRPDPHGERAGENAFQLLKVVRGVLKRGDGPVEKPEGQAVPLAYLEGGCTIPAVMRKIALGAVIGAGMMLTASAGGSQLSPTARQLAWARAKAGTYWHVPQPPCGRERVSLGSVPGKAAMAYWSSCSIVFDAQRDWRDFPTLLCHAYVHEYGHLVLGPNYFATSNPGDPMHSTNPRDIMYGGTPTWQQQAAQDRAVGCAPRSRHRG
jgi:hypothetical protein